MRPRRMPTRCAAVVVVNRGHEPDVRDDVGPVDTGAVGSEDDEGDDVRVTTRVLVSVRVGEAPPDVQEAKARATRPKLASLHPRRPVPVTSRG